jgi:hypothetical protein
MDVNGDVPQEGGEDGEVHGEEGNRGAAAQNNEVINRYAQMFDEKRAADILGTAQTSFEEMRATREAAGIGNYAPFADKDEWELAEWLINNVNQRATDEFLKLPIVSNNKTSLRR